MRSPGAEICLRESGDRGRDRGLPSRQRACFAKAERIINLPSSRSRVEFKTTDATTAQEIEAALKQGLADAAPAILRAHQHHSDPGEVGAVDRGRGRTHRAAVPFREETT